MALYLINVSDAYLVVPVIIVLAISASNSYFDKANFKLITFTLYVVACMFDHNLLFYIPLISYDLFLYKKQWALLLLVIPIKQHFQLLNVNILIFVFLFAALAFYMKYCTLNYTKEIAKNKNLRDSTKEITTLFEHKNKELMDKQDYEVNLATLNERNRIARDIHDSVGHLLSSSILQIGAILAISKDENTKENLTTIKKTLSQGMDSIRHSIHNLHEESIDLNNEVNVLVRGFSFCKITLDYDIQSNIDKGIKYSFISIIKEALSNIIKHSNAANVSVVLREHPTLFQLVIQDDGTIRSSVADYNDGIGIKNIIHRVTILKGNVNINEVKGFKIFITIPKE